MKILDTTPVHVTEGNDYLGVKPFGPWLESTALSEGAKNHVLQCLDFNGWYEGYGFTVNVQADGWKALEAFVADEGFGRGLNPESLTLVEEAIRKDRGHNAISSEVKWDFRHFMAGMTRMFAPKED